MRVAWGARCIPHPQTPKVRLSTRATDCDGLRLYCGALPPFLLRRACPSVPVSYANLASAANVVKVSTTACACGPVSLWGCLAWGTPTVYHSTASVNPMRVHTCRHANT